MTELTRMYLEHLKEQTYNNMVSYVQKARAAMSAMELKDATYFIGRACEERAKEGLLEELLR